MIGAALAVLVPAVKHARGRGNQHQDDIARIPFRNAITMLIGMALHRRHSYSNTLLVMVC